MITELAFLQIDPTQATDFEAAVAGCQKEFETMDGCHGLSLGKVMEVPGKYVLVVKWETLDAHMVDFRESENFQNWRKAVGGFFTAPPVVEHIDSTVYF